MIIHLTYGWWILPTLVTLTSFAYVWRRRVDGGNYGAGHVWNAFMMMAATCASLMAWLAWALLAR
ncbi:hypothetical protein BA190_26835 [Labrys sp. WJW]|uniref:hypothetical protein n=1 Tax=Labrys sp. WJW TaxID=1737983 RepID=UPI00082E4358|nr:hypothetical protein [Labrys sp. WJW]OCC01831.1 hypothetical protein BA190_26835 [Labrys sp. WJW]